MRRAPLASRWVALTLVATLSFPLIALTVGCGKSAPPSDTNSSPMVNNSPTTPTGPAAKPGLTTKQKVVLVAGAALLFYLYKRYQAQNAAAAAQGGSGHPQLYREEKGPNKGAIYYRKNDANHTVVWLKAPPQGMEVPADQVQKYLPGYNGGGSAYQGQVNTDPQPGVMGGTVESADQYAAASDQ